MKKISQITLVIIFVLSSFGLSAQGKYKFGHIDSQKLLEVMPERGAAVKELQNYATELEETLTTMQKEFEQKYAEYVARMDSLSDFLKKEKLMLFPPYNGF